MGLGADGGIRTLTLHRRNGFSYHFDFRRRANHALVVWTIPSPSPVNRKPASGAARLVSTPSCRIAGLARDQHRRCRSAFPEFERFCTAGFPTGTQFPTSPSRLPVPPRPQAPWNIIPTRHPSSRNGAAIPVRKLRTASPHFARRSGSAARSTMLVPISGGR